MTLLRRAIVFGAVLTAVGTASAAVETGLDVLESQKFAPLWGKRIGVIVNRTSVDRQGKNLVDLLIDTPGVTLAAIFSPEHGFSGTEEHGRPVNDGTYRDTGVPIFSLYGKNQRPTPEALDRIDALVFDLQDVGTRFYTYITTLGYALEEAARADKEFIVLDRPNPLGGAAVEGLVLSTEVRHFTAYYSIPVRHGLTVGELAQWHDAHAGLNARLMVIPVKGWRRSMLWDETGLPWVPPSPNIKTPRAALLYCGVGAFESTNVSVGRGTATPFEVFGAPWLKGVPLAKKLNALKMEGVRFRSATFRPTSDRYRGERCYGVRVLVDDPRRARPVDLFVNAACLLRDARPAAFRPRWAEMPRVVGSGDFEIQFNGGASAADLLGVAHRSAAAFDAERRPHLLYR